MRYVLLLAVGVAIGYALGFRDAQVHKDNVLDRAVSRVGGPARANVGNDIDKRMEKIVP